MKQFFDTSVLVAAFWSGHPQHEKSLKVFADADRTHSACAIHSLAEVYAVMSVLPVRPVLPAEQVLLFVQEVQDRCTLVTLDENEYFDTIRRTAEQGYAGGRIYDALLLRCAAKANPEIIYTWNLKHFLALAPEMSGRIRAPG